MIVLFIVAQMTDSWTFHHFTYPAVYDRPWGRMLRLAGYAPLWALIAIALVLHDWRPRLRATLWKASRRGLLLLGAVALAGLVAEALKLTLRRERPGLTGGAHLSRPWADHPFSSAQLGLPSSEVAVAFAAAAILARVFPESRGLWYGIAIGCALTRVASGAHFVSDVALGALVGYVVSVSLWQSNKMEAPA
ncbi:MAG TPA: phosphatase PAP2 family protein [Gemmatimonadales bacterium]|nr:phosphatase PAP2 family protein [Gemmatimonadales bacterium]